MVGDSSPVRRGRNSKNNCPTIVNRIAQFRYEILDRFECGIELAGSEVKSIRAGGLQLRDGYARVSPQNELFLHNVNIAKYSSGGNFDNHDPDSVRRLLLHKKDIRKLRKEQEKQGLTLIPLRSYFSDRGWVKVEIGLCRGKNLQDKRETIKKREDERDVRRVLKEALG